MSKAVIGTAFLATLSFNCADATVAYLVNIHHIPVYQIILVRDTIIFAGYFAYLHALGTPNPFLGPEAVRHWIWARGVITSISLICSFLALSYLSISEFSTAFCLCPFATAIMCRLFVGEPFRRFQAVCCAISLSGVLLITDPFRAWSHIPTSSLAQPQVSSGRNDGLPEDFIAKLIGIGIVIPSVLLYGGEMVTMRYIKDQADCSQIMVVIGFCPAVLSACIMLITQTAFVCPPLLSAWLLLAVAVCMGLMGQLLLTYCSAKLTGIQTTVAMYSGVVNMTVIQWVIYGNHPSAIAYIGMMIVVAAGLSAVIEGRQAQESANNHGTEGGIIETDSTSVPLLGSTTTELESPTR